ncbi:MAG TPA: extracellular solute-binding protein, partial [Desulfatiglandales bacterium]|nr:extracellular solute-binding protein [Desulfatiglandales bacterium]
FVRQNGGNFLTKDGKPAFNTPEWVEALGYFTDLVANKKVNIITDIKEVRAGDSFLQGRAAISQIWSGQLMNLLKNDPSLRDKIGTINMKRKKVSVWSGMVFPFISSGSEHKDLAWKFVQFILSPEEMWQRYKETRCPVVRKSLKDRYIEDYPIINKVIWEGIPIGEGVAKVPWMPKVLEQITRAMQESFHEGKPPAQALNEATERLLKEIDSDPKQMRVY